MSPMEPSIPDDVLTFEIGRIARRDAELEAHARELWVTLAGRNARPAVPRGMRDVFDGCAALIEALHGSVPKDLTIAALDAIKEARAAHDRRNTLVHERWRVTGREQDRWVSATYRPSPAARPEWTIEDFRAGSDGLARATFRLIAAYKLIGALGTHQLSARIDIRPRWEAMLRGEFALSPNGGAVLTDQTLAGPML